MEEDEREKEGDEGKRCVGKRRGEARERKEEWRRRATDDKRG